MSENKQTRCYVRSDCTLRCLVDSVTMTGAFTIDTESSSPRTEWKVDIEEIDRLWCDFHFALQ
jgi:hypothetical protein